MKITFSQKAWDDYLEWQRQDKKKFKKINTLIKNISRTPMKVLVIPNRLSMIGQTVINHTGQDE